METESISRFEQTHERSGTQGVSIVWSWDFFSDALQMLKKFLIVVQVPRWNALGRLHRLPGVTDGHFQVPATLRDPRQRDQRLAPPPVFPKGGHESIQLLLEALGGGASGSLKPGHQVVQAGVRPFKTATVIREESDGAGKASLGPLPVASQQIIVAEVVREDGFVGAIPSSLRPLQKLADHARGIAIAPAPLVIPVEQRAGPLSKRVIVPRKTCRKEVIQQRAVRDVPVLNDRARHAGYERFDQRREPDEIGTSYGIAACEQFRHSVETLVRFSAPECM